MRTAASTLLMILASLLVLGAVTGSLVDRVAHTSGPTRAVAASLPQDQDVRAALPPLVLHRIVEQLPGGMQVPSALEGLLERASAKAVNAALDSSGFQPAWVASVESSRQAYVHRLEAVRAGDAETAPAALDLGPLATQGVKRLHDDVDSAGLGVLSGMLPSQVDASVTLDLPGTDHAGSERIATLVWAAGFWGWALALALVAAVASLWCARRPRRGPVLAIGGLVTCLWAAVLLAAPWSPGGASHPALQQGAVPSVSEAETLLGHAVQQHVVRALSGELGSAAIPCLIGGGVVVAVGVVMGLIEVRRGNR